MDILSIIGIIIGVGAILLGQYLDGGHVTTLLNGPALIIVLGGSLGAIMLQSPLSVFLHAMRLLSWVFKPPQLPLDASIQRIIHWSDVARREGLLGWKIRLMVNRISLSVGACKCWSMAMNRNPSGRQWKLT